MIDLPIGTWIVMGLFGGGIMGFWLMFRQMVKEKLIDTQSPWAFLIRK